MQHLPDGCICEEDNEETEDGDAEATVRHDCHVNVLLHQCHGGNTRILGSNFKITNKLTTGCCQVYMCNSCYGNKLHKFLIVSPSQDKIFRYLRMVKG